jgi:hypothetical protein
MSLWRSWGLVSALGEILGGGSFGLACDEALIDNSGAPWHVLDPSSAF